MLPLQRVYNVGEGRHKTANGAAVQRIRVVLADDHLILREGMLLTGLGLIIGLAGAFALTRFLQSLLCG